MFVRNDRQDIYRIPTQVHWVGTALSRPLRLVLGLGWLGAIYGLYCLLTLLPSHWSPSLIGPVAGLTLGTALAIGGGTRTAASRSSTCTSSSGAPSTGRSAA